MIYVVLGYYGGEWRRITALVSLAAAQRAVLSIEATRARLGWPPLETRIVGGG